MSMNLVKLNKRPDILLGELDKMIVTESVQNELNLAKADKFLLLDNSKNNEMYMFNSNNKRILVSIDRKAKKEQLINIDKFRYMGMIAKNDLSSDELRFIAANL